MPLSPDLSTLLLPCRPAPDLLPARSWLSRSPPMSLSRAPGLALATALALVPAAHAQRATSPPAAQPAVDGMTLQVDASDIDRKVLQVRQTLAVRPGPLRLAYPRWLPGQHAPNGDVGTIAGLKITTPAGQSVTWQRDPLDTHLFDVTVPPGSNSITLEFQHLTPTTSASGRVSVTREMLNLQWQSVVLYPAGRPAAVLPVQATLQLPPGWTAATALRLQSREGDTWRYRTASLDTLIDSPVMAGRHVRRIELDPPGTPQPVALNLLADSAELLLPQEAQIEAHRELVRQSDRLFGARHFRQYDFLLALSEELGGIGLEHHESSENGVRTNYWEAWERRAGSRELLPHEYAHAWNGKHRRPVGLTRPDFQAPMQTALLWLYEGQTQYWGWVLAARSGLTSATLARQGLAQTAAYYDNQAARAWRSLQDTTQDPIVSARRGARDWRTWQRTSGDYYGESLLIWLDVDTLIREKSGGTRSLDDFARAFFGTPGGARAAAAGAGAARGADAGAGSGAGADPSRPSVTVTPVAGTAAAATSTAPVSVSAQVGEPRPLTYTFEDIVAALDGVVRHDWAAFLRRRLDSNEAGAPLDGIARAGWKLVYAEVQTDSAKADEAENRDVDLSYSLGLRLGGRGLASGSEGRVASVLWGSPAFEAGIAPGVTLLAVNGRAYKAEALRQAITDNKTGTAPIDLLLRDGEHFRTLRLDYRGGLRFPRLERAAGDDRLGALLAPR